jgi:hypothetical protein
MPGQIVTANLYQLDGHSVHVSYATSGIDGKPSFNYQDAHQSHAFRGDGIRAVECDVGVLVSVTLRLTVDAGSTTFSLLVPRVQLEAGTNAQIQTQGITSLHRFSIIPILNRGQLDTYSVMPLHGTASFVMF